MNDLIRVAQLCGIASNHAGRNPRGSYNQAEAVAELRAVSTDPKLLAQAICSPRHHQFETIRAMLIAAGATAKLVDDRAAVVDERLKSAGFPVGEGWEHPPNG